MAEDENNPFDSAGLRKAMVTHGEKLDAILDGKVPSAVTELGERMAREWGARIAELDAIQAAQTAA